MNKKYETQLPVSMYIQMISSIIITLLLLVFELKLIESLSVFHIIILLLCIIFQVVIMAISLKRVLKKYKGIEINEHRITINNIEIPIHEIEKIIIEGYFIQSVGIKLYGKRLVPADFHFKFKFNQEDNIKELKQWAIINGIKITNGKIYRWI
jgi:energy-coupling factor transporter transmembrane protein EcfT